MAELVDAADSKSAVRKDVQVRFLFWAQNKNPHKHKFMGVFICFHLVIYSYINMLAWGYME